MFLNSETEESSYRNFAVIYTLCINDLLSYGISMGFDEEICQDAAHDVFCNLYIKKKKLNEADLLNLGFYTRYGGKLVGLVLLAIILLGAWGEIKKVFSRLKEQ